MSPARPPWSGEIGRLKILNQLLAALSQASDVDEVYQAALSSLLQATEADRAAILLFDEAGVIQFVASSGLSPAYRKAVTGHSPWKPGMRNAEPLVVPDVFLEESLAQFNAIFESEGIRALVAVPLALDAGVFGKFMLYYAQPHECGAEELEIARAIAFHVALANERKRAELARRGSEERLHAILDNSPAIIFLKDPAGRYLLVNQRYLQLFHLDREKILGHTDYEIFPKDVAARFLANDRIVIETGEPLTVEEVAPQDDGPHTYIVTKFPMRRPDATVHAVCGIGTDVTEQKQLELMARRMAAIVESSNDAIIGKDLRGIITSWNQGAERLYGYLSAEAVGQPISMIAAPGHLDEMPEILARIRRGERVEHFETQRQRKDGQIIDVSLTVSPVHDSAGQIVGASKIARDITDRKQAEQERLSLLEREKEARRTAELLNRVGPRLAAQLDPDKLVQEVIDLATALVGAGFGAFFRRVAGKDGETNVLYALSGISLEEFRRLQLPAADASIQRVEDLAAGVDGNPSIRSSLSAPVTGRSGEVLGMLFFAHSQPRRFSESHEAILTGIAAQTAISMDNARLFEQAQRVQTELKRSNEELRRANRDLEVFAYSAGHDLQDPLHTIAISAELLQRSVGARVQGDEAMFLCNVITSARRMSVFLDDLLSYTRAARSEEGPAPPADSGRILAEVVASLSRPIEQAAATVTSGRLPVVAIHENRLALVFQNLIGNAIKYRSQEPPRVEITAAEQDGWWVFSISDNGIGIEQEFAEQIFGLFRRLHGPDEYPGSGMGLAICQRVVEQYGGRIWLDASKPGEGSTFCFSVPGRA